MVELIGIQAVQDALRGGGVRGADLLGSLDSWCMSMTCASDRSRCSSRSSDRRSRRSGKNHRTTNRLATALRVAAQALETSDSALGSFYRRMKRRHGPEKAINATANKLARMIYLTLKHQHPYIDPGTDYYTRRHQQKILKNMEKTAQRLGYTLVKTAA